jgi:thiopurine S-methyltransferase
MASEQEESEATRLSRWQVKWKANQTNWHVDGVHRALEKHKPTMAEGTRVLFPLCGKSVDMEILANQGCDVVGVDGCPEALAAFVSDRKATIASEKKQLSTVNLQSSRSIGFFVGDFIGLTPGDTGGSFDFAFDRGSLVAITPDDRPAYASTLSSLVTGTLLLVCVEHGPFFGGKLGPPFSIAHADVESLFGESFSVELLEREDRMQIEPVWKERGCEQFDETTYLLKRR